MPRRENVLTVEERVIVGADVRPIPRFRQPKDEPRPARDALNRALRYDSPLCEGVDPELWFPDIGVNFVDHPARRICDACPLQIRCRDAARENGEEYGMWGGETPAEREQFNPQAKDIA